MALTRRFLALAAASALCAAIVPATAQAAAAWPDKPITFITPYPPGGSADIITRFIADRVSKQVGKPIIVENRAGAAATLGTDYAARAAPDGYTFLVTPMATVTIAPWLRKLNYSVDSFVPVAKLASSYGLITTSKDAPFSNYKEFVASAKANPGKYSFATNGVGSIVHLSAVLLHKQAGIDVLHVPYKGAAESMTDLIGGRVTLMYDPATAPRVKDGTLKGLATTADVRNPELPNIPTLEEQGFKLPFSGSWFGIFAPKGTSEAIVGKMAAYVKQALEMPGVREQLQLSALYPDFQDSASFAKQVRADSDTMREVIQKENIKLD